MMRKNTGQKSETRKPHQPILSAMNLHHGTSRLVSKSMLHSSFPGRRAVDPSGRSAVVAVDGESSAVLVLHLTHRCSSIISKPSAHVSVYERDWLRWMLLLEVPVELLAPRVGSGPRHGEQKYLQEDFCCCSCRAIDRPWQPSCLSLPLLLLCASLQLLEETVVIVLGAMCTSHGAKTILEYTKWWKRRHGLNFILHRRYWRMLVCTSTLCSCLLGILETKTLRLMHWFLSRLKLALHL